MKFVKTPVRYLASYYGRNDYLTDAENYLLVKSSSDVVDPEPTLEEIAEAINMHDKLVAIAAKLAYENINAAQLAELKEEARLALRGLYND